jgi:hypothetical protein
VDITLGDVFFFIAFFILSAVILARIDAWRHK